MSSAFLGRHFICLSNHISNSHRFPLKPARGNETSILKQMDENRIPPGGCCVYMSCVFLRRTFITSNSGRFPLKPARGNETSILKQMDENRIPPGGCCVYMSCVFLGRTFICLSKHISNSHRFPLKPSRENRTSILKKMDEKHIPPGGCCVYMTCVFF